MIRLCEPFRGLLYVPFYLVEALGAYEAEGLSVELHTAPSPAEAALALLAGDADVAWGGPMRVMHHHDRDPDCPLVLFAEAVTRDPFLLVGSTAHPDFTLNDLRELRLATVSEVPTPWLCLQEDLRRAGVDPDTIERVADRTMAENAEALRGGEVDVIQVFEPHAEILIRAGAGQLWQAAAGRGHTAYTAFYATRETLEGRGEALLRMTRALHRAQRWLESHEAGEVSGAVARYFPDLPREVLAGAVARYQGLGVWSGDPIVRREGFDRLKAGLLSGGWISRDIPYEACVDTQLAKRAIA